MNNIILHILILIALLFSIPLSAEDKTVESYDGSKEKLHVYLLIGQSNMAGRAPFTEEESGIIEGVYLLNDKDKWEPAKNPLNQYSTIRKGLEMQKLNPGYSFSKTMLEKKEEISVGLVVNARGGSSIKEWTKESKFYKEAVRRTKVAMETGELKGVLWHQGESDAEDPEYLGKLKLLIENLRSDFSIPDLPFVAGQVNDVPLVNDQIAKLPETVDSTGFVSSEGLKAMDRWHFDAKSMNLLGQRYAEELLRIQSKQKAEQENAPDKK